MQQNSKCRLFSDRDTTINHIICKCSKLAQKEYKSRYDWGGVKVILMELCKKFKLYHTYKRYMYKSESVSGEGDAQSSLEFWDTNGSLNLCQTTRRSDSQKKDREPFEL